MTELAALAVQPSTFDPMKALLVASQLRQADATNTMANLAISERQTGQNALLDYNRRTASGDPNAIDALNVSPEKKTQMLQANSLQTDEERKRVVWGQTQNAFGAVRVLQATEGEARDTAWKDEISKALSEKRINQQTHDRLAASKPDEKTLRAIILAGLPSIESYLQQTRQDTDRAAGKVTLDKLGAAYGGAIPDPNANRTVSQATSGAISPIAFDPSQGLPEDSFRTPLSPTPRVTPQQVAEARTQPQLDPNSGMVTPAIPPVPFMGDEGQPAVAPMGGASAPATAGAPPLATSPAVPSQQRQQRTVASAQSGPITMQPKIADTDKIPLLIAAAGMPGIPESVQKVATELLKNEHKDTKVLDDTKQRLASVMAMGLDPRSPMMQSFILSGKMPREDQQLLTATDKKAIMEADEHVMTNEASIAKLKEAKLVSKDAYTGPLAAQRGYAMSLLGSKAGEQTSNLHNLVTSNALDSLKSIFGAAPTEGERKILLDIQGSTSQPDKVRQEIYDRAIGAAERRLEFNRKRAKELREGTMYKPDGSGRVTTDQPTPPPGFDLVK